MFLGTRTKCFLDDSREEEACRESRTSNQPILPIQTCPVFTLSTRFRRIIILILRKSRDAHFHFADSPSRYIIDRNFVPKISFLFFFVSRSSLRFESSLSSFVACVATTCLDKIENGMEEGGRKNRKDKRDIVLDPGSGWKRVERKRAKKRDDEQPTGPFKVPRRQQRASNELIKLSNSFELASERANKCSPLPRGPLHRFRAPSVQL